MRRTYTVKELADISGVSRRTLQYYDNEGLLTATRDENGHRVYDEDHLQRLTQINFYKSLGFSLEQIKVKLASAGSKASMEAMLEAQSRLLHRQLESVQAKLHGIEVSQNLLSAGYSMPWEVLSCLMQALELDPVDHWGEYAFPEADLALFSKLFPTRKEMLDFYDEFRRLMVYAAAYHASGVPLASDLAKALFEDWQAMVARVTSGDPAITAAFQRVDENRASWSQGERDLMAEGEPYLQQVIEHYGGGEPQG
ncbi:MerR family transcriptional regulator [Paenibacillus sp. 1P07SE]|uniref:MerR family transcriptional regulator n=1 Tax=Paenibacillus sp. 1P07SE TaxID=3132209 RepID=UPI0039A5E6F0